MAAVSFAKDIKPLFRAVDIEHMKRLGIDLDDYQYMADPANDHENAESVQQALTPQNGDPPSMPPEGPYWTPAQLALFAQWRADGYQP